MALKAGRVGVKSDQVDSTGKIISGGGGGGGSAKHVYSTEEQIIGKWIDGKDIYEIVLELTSNSADVSDLNIDKLIHIDAIGSESAGYTGNLWTICSVSGADYRNVFINASTSKVSIGGNYPCIYAILQYTKKEV